MTRYEEPKKKTKFTRRILPYGINTNRYVIEYRIYGKLRSELLSLEKVLIKKFPYPKFYQFGDSISHITLIPPINQNINKEFILKSVREEFKSLRLVKINVCQKLRSQVADWHSSAHNICLVISEYNFHKPNDIFVFYPPLYYANQNFMINCIKIMSNVCL